MAAGRQMRRQAFPPVFTHEVEPGAAIDIASKHPFPFDSTKALSPALTEAIHYVAEHQSTIKAQRQRLVKYWRRRAEVLRPKSLAFIKGGTYENIT